MKQEKIDLTQYDSESVKTPVKRPLPPGHSYSEPPLSDGSGIERLLQNHPGKQGYIVGRLENEFLRLNTDAHLITVAPTGAGKGRGAIIPNLLDHPGSAFVVDISGETVAQTADARLLMGQQVVVLDPYDVTGGRWGNDCFNPFDILNPHSRNFEQEANRITQAIMFDSKGRSSNEPIWDNSTRLAINGALLYITTCRPPEHRNLAEFRKLFSVNPKKRLALIEEIQQAVKVHKVDYSGIEDFIEFLTDAAEKTKIPDNAFVQAKTCLAWAGWREFKHLISHSTFSFDQLQKTPTTVYLVLPEEYIEGCEVWVRLLFNTALFQLKDVNTVFGCSSRKLLQAKRVLFLLDEFAAFGKIDSVERGMATVRKRGANIWLFLQHISQLDYIYGEHCAKTIIGNAAMMQTFESNEIHELEYFSRVLGKELFDVRSVTIGASVNEGGNRSTAKTVTVANAESDSYTKSHSKTQGENESASTGSSESTTRGSSESATRGSSENTTKGRSQSNAVGSSKSSGIGSSATKGRSSSDGRGHNLNYSQGEGWGGEYKFLDMVGIDFPWRWDQKNQSNSRGGGSSRNWSQGLNSSYAQSGNQSKSTSKSKTMGTSESTSIGSSESATRGTTESTARGTSHTTSRGTSHAQTEGQSETKGTTKTQSEGQTESEGTTRSEGSSISYTVKAEEQSVETSRSLRVKMSGTNQLLMIRGQHPFLCPRMDYIATHPDHGGYRFPELALLSGVSTFEEIYEAFHQEYPVYEQELSSKHRPSLDHTNYEPLFLSSKEQIHMLEDAYHAAREKGENGSHEKTQIQKEMKEISRAVSGLNDLSQDFEKFGNGYRDARENGLFFLNFLQRFLGAFEAEPQESLMRNTENLDEYHDLLNEVQNFKRLRKLVKVLNQYATPPQNHVDENHIFENAGWLISQYGGSFSALHSQLHEQDKTLKSYDGSLEGFSVELGKLVERMKHYRDKKLLAAARNNIARRHEYLKNRF